MIRFVNANRERLVFVVYLNILISLPVIITQIVCTEMFVYWKGVVGLVYVLVFFLVFTKTSAYWINRYVGLKDDGRDGRYFSTFALALFTFWIALTVTLFLTMLLGRLGMLVSTLLPLFVVSKLAFGSFNQKQEATV